MVASRALRWCLLGVLTLTLLSASLLAYSRVADQRLQRRISSAYTKGLAFLAKSQLDTGEFPTYSWLEGKEGNPTYERTPFTASQVLHSLAFGEGGEAERRIRERVVAYLLAHMEPPGMWRYHGKDDRRLPPDVDDTAQAWAALSENGVAVNPDALLRLKKNRTEAGLFNTWIAEPDEISWMDNREREVDLIVNLNALFLFARLGQSLPEVCGHVIEYTQAKAFHHGTVWYPSPFAFTYFLSRAYADGRAMCLHEAITAVRAYVFEHQQPDGAWGDDIQTVLAVLTLLNLGERGNAMQRGMRAVLARQQSDGGWAMASLYKGYRGGGLHYGSRMLTTSLCLEALGKYRRE